MGLYIVKADITIREVDAIVCTANTRLHLGGNMGNKILVAAGKDILTELNQIGHCDVGNSVITKGYGLKAKYVIHTVGPRYIDGKHGEAKLLEQAYMSALNLALDHGFETIELPLISSGSFRYPNREAADIAIKTISKFLEDNELSVGLVIYSTKTFEECEDLFKPYVCYIGNGYVKEIIDHRIALPEMEKTEDDYLLECGRFENRLEFSPSILKKAKQKPAKHAGQFTKLEPNFSSKFLNYLNRSGKTNSEVYNKVGIDRRLFSKILSSKDYKPKKITVICLVIGMELTIEEAEDLLDSAGFSFSKSIMFDSLIKEFIEDENYDVDEINDILYKYNQPLIGY